MKLIQFTKPSRTVGEILLNRPDKLNALSLKMITEFLEILDQVELEAAQLKLHIVTLKSAAAPKAFCAGADLSERVKMSEKEVSETLKIQRQLMDRVAGLPCPVLASINGIAFGGGLELALCADWRVMNSNTQIGLTETQLAIIPGAGGTQRLRMIVGEARAKEMIYFAKKIDAPTALNLGLVNEISDAPDKVLEERVQELLAKGPLALFAAKRAIEGYRSFDNLRIFDFERECYESVLKSEDRVEGLNAFVEKRSPRYHGK